MFKKTLLAASAVALFMGSGAASAATESYSAASYFTLSPTSTLFPTTDWFANFGIPKFDTTGGRILDSVSLDVGAQWTGSISATSNTAGTQTVVATLKGEVGIGAATNTETGGGANSWWMFASGSDTQSAQLVGSGSTATIQTAGTLSATANATILGAASVVTNPTTPVPGFNTTALGSLFTSLQSAGAGVFDMTAYGANRHQLTTGNFSATGTGTSTPTLNVVYTYHTNTVPEPAALALLAIGAAGFAASKRRKMAVAA